MSQIKTVTHEGQVYQIGKEYLFSMSGVTWFYDKLIDIDGGYPKPFCTKSKEWRYIKEVPASENMGTITPAPIELVDGAAYMFDINGFVALGFYREDRKSFFSCGNKVCGLAEATDIRLMTVGSE
jgi:hypothetical protein